MPTYRFLDTETDTEFDLFLSIKERDEFLKANKNLNGVITAPNIISGTGGIKNDEGWNEVLQKVSEAHPESPLASKHIRKSSKEVATAAAVNKWRKKAGLQER